MSDTNQENQYLNHVFQENLLRFEKLLTNYSFREKFIISNWLTKLKKSNATNEELKLRNRFLQHFLNNQESETNVFRNEPFMELPENFNGPLIDLKYLLPKAAEDDSNPTENGQHAMIADLLKAFPDDGAFLKELPVPRNGSFRIFVLIPDESAVCSNQ